MLQLPFAPHPQRHLAGRHSVGGKPAHLLGQRPHPRKRAPARRMRGEIILVMCCLKRLGEAVQKRSLQGGPVCMIYSTAQDCQEPTMQPSQPITLSPLAHWRVHANAGILADVKADDVPITRLLRKRLTMPRTAATIVKMHPQAKQSRPPRKLPENTAGKVCRM